MQLYTWTQINVKEQLVVIKDMDVNEHERYIYIFTLKTQTKVKIQDSNCCSAFHSHCRVFKYEHSITNTKNDNESAS